MGASSRHHYIPQFLIRHFTDEQGFLCIYDKQTRQLAQRSPKMAFYEWNRNTFTIGDKEVDNLEKLYAALDEEFAVNMAEVLSSHTHDTGSLTNLLLLALTLKWRTPASDEEFNHLKEDTTLADLGVSIRPKDPSHEVEPAVLQRLLNSPLFKESKRLLLPVQLFLTADKSVDEARLIELHDSSYIHRLVDQRYPALLGDCGIIEQEQVAYDQLGSFIFPLASTATLVCTRNSSPRLTDLAQFYASRDLTTLFTARRYVGCANRGHLQSLVTLYEAMKSQPGMERYVRQALFEVA